MGISYEESKKQYISQLAATPMVMTLASTSEEIAAYAGEEEFTPDATGRYEWHPEYTDDKISFIDENKTIILDKSQINLTQECNSQYVPFQMPRKYDGFDLSSGFISIRFDRADGNGKNIPAVNVSYSADNIRFAWLVDSDATYVAGTLQFEVHVNGNNQLNRPYCWKTKTCKDMTVIQALKDPTAMDNIQDEAWVATIVEKTAASVAEKIAEAEVGAQVQAAQNAATDAQNAANLAIETADAIEGSVDAKISSQISEALSGYYDSSEIDEMMSNLDLTEFMAEVDEKIAAIDGLANFRVEYDGETMTFYNGEEVMQSIEITSNTDPSVEWTNAYTSIIEGKISDSVGAVQNELDAYKNTTDADLTSIHEAIDDLPETLQNDYYNKDVADATFATKTALTETNTLVSSMSSTVEANKTDIGTISSQLGELQTTIESIDTSPRVTYDIAYNDASNPEVGENGLVLYEIKNEGDSENEERTVKNRVVIVGGTGGGTSSTLKIEYVTTSPVVATLDDSVVLKYIFSGTDSSGDIVSDGTATWKVAGRVVATNIATYGENTFDVTPYLSLGTQKVVLSITDDAGSLVTKTWTVQQVDIRLESSFSDAYTYNGNVSFSYTAYGSIEKQVHFILDGKELGVVTVNTSGVPASYTLPAQEHGSHFLETYLTAEVNGKTVGLEEIIDEETEEVTGYNYTIKVNKDIMWCDATSSIPIIGCATPTISAIQYNNVNIKYVVYDPRTETPEVIWLVDGVEMPVEMLSQKDEKGYYTYSYKATEVGTHTLTITCGEAEPKVVTVNVEKLDITVSPVTEGLAFDFNPVGYTNNSVDRLWSYGDVTMTVTPDFDWVNGGYHTDENGDQYFCVKAGTYATINYNLFADDATKTGKEFKVIFRTKNIRKRDTSFLTCLDGSIGLDMKVEHAFVYDNVGVLKSNYCEDTIIEYEFNINKNADMMVVLSYEDGAPSTPYEYSDASVFKQTTAKPIVIGSEDCDIHIYRMKAYSNSLLDTQIKDNFIADARNANEMISRYTRNQIYDSGVLVSTSASGGFSAEALMKAAPDLRYIFLEVPQFTNDKDNKIDGCTVYFRYPAGTRPEDNWTCTGMRHRGQGTSSNLYGYAGRNIDLCMDRSTSLFTWTDDEGKTVESSTITLTDTSVPTDYLNIKVNIASSENENNAQMARRFNEYQPFLRYARKKDSKVKDTMEFYNCVVFIRETGTDDSTPHREFNDTNWHFYAIGNIGDSKKTDDTRVNDKNDPREHVVEIMDVDKPLSKFPTGMADNVVCPVENWSAGNSAYDILHSTNYVYDEEGAFASFGGETYEFRYEMEDLTAEQREVNINVWRDLYKFIVTSTDEEFYANLKNYFVVDTALYYYLFTERYTMVDNRAKNSFWHYGKVYISNEEAAALGETEASYYIVDDEAAAINNGYRYDLTFGYDFDTCLGIDNTGDFVFPYGREDTDYYVEGDPTSDYVFRVADSTFFCRLRDLFPSEMQAMFKNREEKNAWSSGSLIAQWDDAQAQFPEELWRLDYERKYYRTYLGSSIDNSISKGTDKTFLIGKFFGRKKYARRAFETNQEMYFATKYFGNAALSDSNTFWIRGNVPLSSDVTPNYSLTLVPYSDMYLCVKYGSTGTPQHSEENGKPKRVKAGETYVFESNAERMDFIYVYAANCIQEIGDLSRCFIGDNNFAPATHLQKLVIGSADDSYENTFMSTLTVANNTLLEHLDLRNISGINTVIDVSGCNNLKELYAEGTNTTGAIFASGGMLEIAHLPGTVKSLTLKNLHYINDFSVEGYDNLETLIVENTPSINTYNIVNSSPLLSIVRLIGLDWNSTYQIQDGSTFNRLLTLRGRDASGYLTDVAVLAGEAYIVGVREKEYADFKAAWPDLNITYKNMAQQFTVTYQNYDGSVLDVQYVEKGFAPVDPITREDNPIAIPTKESSVSTNFTFAGWDSEPTFVTENLVVTATYSESLRKYSISYASNGITLNGYPKEAEYGTIVPYIGDTPVYTAEESAPYYKFYLFDGWDKSGYVDGNKTINAVFDSCEYVSGYFEGKELSELRPVEIYAMMQLGMESNYIESKDNFTISLGNDVSYDDVEEAVLIDKPVVFNGSNCVDTGLKLFDEDRSFVLAIDYAMTSENKNNNVLAQCYSGSDMSGFRLAYSSGVKLNWGASSMTPSAINRREIMVLRHIAGETGIHVYCSNSTGSSYSYTELSGSHAMIHNNTLVFGCSRADDGVYENYALGTVYWSKAWFVDLGDETCSLLAYWPHETIDFEMCGFRRYYRTDITSKMSSMSFLAATPLTSTQVINSTPYNSGGWAEADLNEYLNSRMYNAIPVKWRQLIKPVKIYSTAGDEATEITSSSCYIYIPSVVELGGDNTSPYDLEGSVIDFMTSNAARMLYDSNGTAVSYWTRSPNIENGTYQWYVTQSGLLSRYSNPNTVQHVRIMISI